MAQPEETKPRSRGYLVCAVLMLLAIGGLNAAGFFVPGFCDWYATNVYPLVTLPFSWAFNFIPIAVGEIIMIVGVVMVALALVLLALLIFLRGLQSYRRFAAGYLKFVFGAVLVVGLLFTLNWAIPFRSTPLSQAYGSSGTYSVEQLESLRNQVVEGLNQAAEVAPRNSDGTLAYGDDVTARSLAALQAQSGEFSRLAGFYPVPKPALCSDVLEWMGIGGYTYPYTQETTYNRHVSQLYYPVLAAHESVHHKGYYLESDAEFLSYLALTRADDAILRYSAYDHMYYYVEAAYKSALLAEHDTKAAAARYYEQTQLSEQAKSDIARDAQDREAAYRESVNQSAETAFSQVAQDASKYGWDAQAQVLQGNIYDGAVGLLISYYGL